MKYKSEKCMDGILKQEATQGLIRAGHGVMGWELGSWRHGVGIGVRAGHGVE